LPNKFIVEELNDEINTLKKENATLLERLEDTRKIVSTYYVLVTFNSAASRYHHIVIYFWFLHYFG